METPKDLEDVSFQIMYDAAPDYVKNIIGTFDDNEDLYAECQRICKELNAVKWNGDYDLSGDMTAIWPQEDSNRIKKHSILQRFSFHAPNKKSIDLGGGFSMMSNNGMVSLLWGDDMYYHDNLVNEFHSELLTKLVDRAIRVIAEKNWQVLGDIPVDEDDNLDVDYRLLNGATFEKGTDKFEVWHYFEETYDLSVFDDLMFGELEKEFSL